MTGSGRRPLSERNHSTDECSEVHKNTEIFLKKDEQLPLFTYKSSIKGRSDFDQNLNKQDHKKENDQGRKPTKESPKPK